jgi:hypothetical protein
MMYVLNADHTIEPMEDPVEWYNRMGSDVITVGHDMIGNVTVVTTFMGTPDGTTSTGKPLLFETGVHKGPMHGRTWRWAGWAEALEGHRRTVEAAKVMEAQAASSSSDTSS